MDRALLEAQLNQAGFTQANQLAAQAFGQQGQLAGLQSGLANQQLRFSNNTTTTSSIRNCFGSRFRTTRFWIQTSC